MEGVGIGKLGWTGKGARKLEWMGEGVVKLEWMGGINLISSFEQA